MSVSSLTEHWRRRIRSMRFGSVNRSIGGACPSTACCGLWIAVDWCLQTSWDTIRQKSNVQPTVFNTIHTVGTGAWCRGVQIYRVKWTGGGGAGSDHQIFMQFFGRKFGRHDSIPLGCILPAWKPYIFQFQLPPLDVALCGGGGGKVLKWTSLNRSPVITTRCH